MRQKSSSQHTREMPNPTLNRDWLKPAYCEYSCLKVPPIITGIAPPIII
jgi:hypothetical protein